MGDGPRYIYVEEAGRWFEVVGQDDLPDVAAAPPPTATTHDEDKRSWVYSEDADYCFEIVEDTNFALRGLDDPGGYSGPGTSPPPVAPQNLDGTSWHYDEKTDYCFEMQDGAGVIIDGTHGADVASDLGAFPSPSTPQRSDKARTVRSQE